jgi:hypothetical protein
MKRRETVSVGHRKVKVARIRITDGGRRALETLDWPEAQ